MKVLHVISGLGTGGAERALYTTLCGMDRTKTEHVVLSLRGEGTFGPRIQALDIPVYSLGMGRGLSGLKTLRNFREVVRKLSPDIIQGWMYHGNLAASVAAWLMTGKRPAVVWNVRHCLYSLKAEKPLTRQVIRATRWASSGVDAIIYNSHLSRDQHRSFGFAGKSGKVIPNGFDTDRLSPDVEIREVARKKMDISTDVLVIGHVARFHPMKDHASFLRAAVEVMRRRADVQCLLVGREVNLDNPALVGIVPPEFEGRFRFAGERDDVPDLMRAMDVFCQSSWSEAFPNVLGEAMAIGVPCVTTNVGDSKDIVGSTGVVVPPSDSAALAEGLLSMLSHSTEERSALGREARLRIAERYSLPSVVQQYSELYTRLLSE